jgi:uncharacterized membrane protein
MSTPPPLRRFRDYTNLPFEVFIAICTVLPIVVLIYFYPLLPERVPEYLNLHGDVEVWGHKGFASVFRLPLMAIDLQVLCLLTKYGVWQGRPVPPVEAVGNSAIHREDSFKTSLNLLDSFRFFIAIKLAASSLENVFYSFERFHSLTTATRITSWVASILGIGGVVFYSYRLLTLSRKLKKQSDYAKGPLKTSRSQSQGIFYYNREDPSWFTDKHLPNFGNKWVYIFLACLLCLPLLMFWPLLAP